MKKFWNKFVTAVGVIVILTSLGAVLVIGVCTIAGIAFTMHANGWGM